VLRVNSPGGSAVASDMIAREVQLLKESGKPVVACMGDVAASGGYYIAGASRRDTLGGNWGRGALLHVDMFAHNNCTRAQGFRGWVCPGHETIKDSKPSFSEWLA
jgi:protease-4